MLCHHCPNTLPHLTHCCNGCRRHPHSVVLFDEVEKVIVASNWLHAFASLIAAMLTNLCHMSYIGGVRALLSKQGRSDISYLKQCGDDRTALFVCTLHCCSLACPVFAGAPGCDECAAAAAGRWPRHRLPGLHPHTQSHQPTPLLASASAFCKSTC